VSRRVSCIPSADATFCDAARAALGQIDQHLSPDAVGPILADLLRAEYPLVVVHRQHPLARIDGVDVWYVYRDGQPLVESAPGGHRQERRT
jgi:hypothetical protein